MRKGLLAVIFFLLLCFAVFQPKTEEVSAASNNGLTIKAYGDSISYGETLSDLTKAYPAVFAEKFVQNFGAQFVAKGVSGDTTTDLLQDLQPYIAGNAVDQLDFEETDIITLCIGANNILGTAINNIGEFLTGSVSEQQYQDMLDAGVAQFKQDFPQILSAFEGKKVLVMTVYNPYKYLSLNDVSIDSSLSRFEPTIRSMLLNYENKFQTMLQMSMNSLQIINNDIRASENNEVIVVDIWSLFETFDKNQYLEYINADISKLTLTMADMGIIYNKDLTPIMNRIITTCDPHPTEAGHAVIAEKHIEKFTLFDLSCDKDLNTVDKEEYIKFIVSPTVDGKQTYKFFKKIENNTELIAETDNNFLSIQAKDLQGSGFVFVEIYVDDQKFETTNEIVFEIEFPEEPETPPPPQEPTNPEEPEIPQEPTNPEEPEIEQAKKESKDNNIVIYVLILMFGLPTITLVIYFVVKAKNKIKIL